MATKTAESIVTQVSADLNDTGNVYWTKSQLLSFLNAGQLEIVIIKPTANTVVSTIQLAAAAAKQEIPTNGLVFLKLIRNRGSDGLAQGTVIREIDGDALDQFDPTWRSTTNTQSEVFGYFYKADAPRFFYVQPIAPVTALYVEIEHSAAPADCTINGVDGSTASTVISLPDEYTNALHQYILYRAYSMETEHAAHQGKAAEHYKLFLGLIQAKAAGE